MAAKWIKENTAFDAHMLVNSLLAFENFVLVGSDGGWWLPLTTDRQISTPSINYGFEQDPGPGGYSNQINNLTFEIQKKSFKM